jgi:hypothetical protein
MATDDEVIAEAKGFAGAAAVSEERSAAALKAGRDAARVTSQLTSEAVLSAGEAATAASAARDFRDGARAYRDELAGMVDGVLPGDPVEWTVGVIYPAARWVTHAGSSYRSLAISVAVEPGTPAAVGIWTLSAGITPEVEAKRVAAASSAAAASSSAEAAAGAVALASASAEQANLAATYGTIFVGSLGALVSITPAQDGRRAEVTEGADAGAYHWDAGAAEWVFDRDDTTPALSDRTRKLASRFMALDGDDGSAWVLDASGWRTPLIRGGKVVMPLDGFRALGDGGFETPTMRYRADGIGGAGFSDDVGWTVGFGADGKPLGRRATGAPDVRPAYSNHLFVAKGASVREISLYPENLVPKRSDSREVVATVTCTLEPPGDTYVRAGSVQIVIDPNRLAEAIRLTVRARGDAETRHVLDVAVHSKTVPTTGTVDVLVIGNSISRQPNLTYVDARLAAWGIGTRRWMGTLTSSTGDAEVPGPLCEARPGWSWTQYTNKIPMAYVAAGDEAAYLALDNTAKMAVNPFVRLATEDDDPAIVRFGKVLDFELYRTRFTGLGAAPKIVLLPQGTNDMNSATSPEAAEADITDSINLFVNRLRAAWGADLIIGILVPDLPRSTVADALWNARWWRGLRATIKAVNALADPKVFVIPTWAHMTPEYWPFDYDPIDAYGVETAVVTDPLHPTSAVRYEMVEMQAAFLLNFKT